MAFRILEFLAEQRGGVGVTALARALSTTKSRVHRHLRTLVEAGYIVQSPETEKYRVGNRLVTLGRAVAENFDLAAIARDEMRALRDTLGQSVVISRAEPAGAVVLATLPGREAIEIAVKPGSLMAPHCTAQGKLGLAHAEPTLRERVLLSRLDLRTPHTITSPTALRRGAGAHRRARLGRGAGGEHARRQRAGGTYLRGRRAPGGRDRHPRLHPVRRGRALGGANPSRDAGGGADLRATRLRAAGTR